MYKYKIGYRTAEYSNYVELIHEDLFSEDELTDMIAEAIIDILPNRYREEYDFTTHFEELFKNGLRDDEIGIIQWLIDNKGFERIEYDLHWSVWGWTNVTDNDWRGYRKDNDKLDEIHDKIMEVEDIRNLIK